MISKGISLKKSKYGYYLIIASAALSALIHVISKPMLESSESMVEINPVVMAFLIYFIGGIFSKNNGIPSPTIIRIIPMSYKSIISELIK